MGSKQKPGKPPAPVKRTKPSGKAKDWMGRPTNPNSKGAVKS